MDDKEKAVKRFVDQENQVVNITPKEVKERQSEAWAKFFKMREEKEKHGK